MLHTTSNRFRQGIVLTFGLLVIALAVFAQAPGKKEAQKKEDSKLTLNDVLVREGKGGLRLKDPSKFELVKQGKGNFEVRFKTSKTLLGTGGCGSCPGDSCDFLFDTPTSGRCHGCGGTKDCTLNPF
ncbi:MAG: hypothetical protein ABI882_14955 [Acidobacteriota bacterium]